MNTVFTHLDVIHLLLKLDRSEDFIVKVSNI